MHGLIIQISIEDLLSNRRYRLYLGNPATAPKRRGYCYSSQKDQVTCPHLRDGGSQNLNFSRLAPSLSCEILHSCSSSEPGQAKHTQQCLPYRVYLPSVDGCHHPCHLGLQPLRSALEARRWRLDLSSWALGRLQDR